MPTEWGDALERYFRWGDLDPHDASDIKVPRRTGPQIKWMFQHTMTAFNVMMKSSKVEQEVGWSWLHQMLQHGKTAPNS